MVFNSYSFDIENVIFLKISNINFVSYMKIDLRWRNTEYVLIHEQNKQISCSSLLQKIEAFKCGISA